MARKGPREKKTDTTATLKSTHALLGGGVFRVSKEATEDLQAFGDKHGDMAAARVAQIARKIASNEKRKTVKPRDVEAAMLCHH